VTTPLVTAMVSTYASERFLAGCLDDLLAQTLGGLLEIVVVDACSPERAPRCARARRRRSTARRRSRAAAT
jgi:glycosyltransferase involved in cell wall biosynthesis